MNQINMTGILELKSRPIKLAFLVDPEKEKSILSAIEFNSTLWGGMFNPIIPLFKSTPTNWEEPFKAPKIEKVIKGYIEAFDPDVIVQCTPDLPKYIEDFGIEIIPQTELWGSFVSDRNDLSPKYGIGIFELYNLVFQEHFRYVEKNPPKIILPKIPDTYSLFWSSLFGNIPSFIKDKINKDYKRALEISSPSVTLGSFEKLMKRKMIFPRRLTQYGLNFLKRSGFMNEDRVFFMDITKNLDIIDYWNLRALGRQVIPCPIQFKDEPSFKHIIVDFLKTVRKPLRGNPQIYNYASFVRSRNSKMEDMQEYVTKLDIKKDPQDTSSEPFFSLQHWYPRIWDEWARNKDGAEADEIYFNEEELDLKIEPDGVRVKFLLPDFAYKYGGHASPRVANDVNFRIYGSDTTFAQVFPKSNSDKFIRAVTRFGIRGDWRIGRNGLVKLVKFDYSENLIVPRANEVFFAWLEDNGWKPKHSPPGLLAQRIYKQLEGNVRYLDDIKLLETLELMTKGRKDNQGMEVGDVKSQFNKFDPNSNLFKFFLSKGVFRVGITIQCPHCQRHSWFSLEGIRDKMLCPICSDQYSSIGNIEKGRWSYKTTGPFSIPGHADGAYCVLLSIGFFINGMHSIRITPVFSFNANDKNGKSLEADFGLIWRETVFGDVMDGVLFGECKTFNNFEKQDFERMKNIATNFPGAVIAFCTLKENLTLEEKIAITEIAKIGRKHWENDRPVNPVLILTRTELTNLMGPPYCWKDKYGNKYDRVYNLLEIADATQQIYLDLPSWKDEWFKEFEEKRKKLQKSLDKGKIKK